MMSGGSARRWSIEWRKRREANFTLEDAEGSKGECGNGGFSLLYLCDVSFWKANRDRGFYHSIVSCPWPWKRTTTFLPSSVSSSAEEGGSCVRLSECCCYSSWNWRGWPLIICGLHYRSGDRDSMVVVSSVLPVLLISIQELPHLSDERAVILLQVCEGL